MGLYADLSTEEMDILHAWERNTRGWINTAATLLAQARALQASLDASGGPRDIITALDNTEEIPNTSGIAGAHNLTRAEMAGIVALLDEFITNNDNAPDRELMSKAAGSTAGLG